MLKAIVEAAGGRIILLLVNGGAFAVFVTYDNFRLSHPDGMEVGNMTVPLPALDPWWLWTICFLLAIGVFRFAWIEARRLGSEPDLYFGDPFVHDVVLWQTRSDLPQVRTPGPQVKVASVGLFNNPHIKNENSKLQRAHVTIKFFEHDFEKKVKTLYFARWADNIQLGHHDSPSTVDPLRYRDIEPNNGQNLIDIALKYPGEANCHTFNSEGWLVPGLKDPKWALPGTMFDICLTVKSSNRHDYKAKFILRNLGQNGSMAIEKGQEEKTWLVQMMDKLWRAANISALKKPANRST